MSRRLLIIATLLIGILTTGFIISCQKNFSGGTANIVFGTMEQEMSALIFIAQDRDFFADNGMNVTIKNYTSGPDSADGLLRGEVNMTVATEFVAVGSAFQNKNLRLLATIDEFENVFVISSAEKGIQNAWDLKGKRIGIMRRAIPEFYLGRFLNLNSMSLQDVTLVDVKPPQYVDAVVKGDVDAVVTVRLFATQIQRALGRDISLMPVQGGQPAYWNILSTDKWITEHPELVTRFLKSIDQAEDYAIHYPDEAESIVQKRLNLDAAYMSSLRSEHQLSLSLDQSLITAMKDEAWWLISNNLTSETEIPDFTKYIYTDGLKAVKPEAVSVIK